MYKFRTFWKHVNVGSEDGVMLGERTPCLSVSGRGVMLLVSVVLFALGGRKKKRQPDTVNDPWPPGLTEALVGPQQLVMLLGQSKVIVQPALLEKPDRGISYVIGYTFLDTETRTAR